MGGLQCHHCQDSVKLQFQRACFQFKALIIQAAGRWGGIKQTKTSYLTTICLEFGFCSSHSMSNESDVGNWWWQGKVALSPTTFFISIWASADSRLSATEEEEKRSRAMSDQAAITMTTGNRENWDRKTQWEVWPRNSISDWWRLRFQSDSENSRFKKKKRLKKICFKIFFSPSRPPDPLKYRNISGQASLLSSL